VNPYIRLMRPVNCVMASLSIPLIAIMIGGIDYLTSWVKILLGMLVVLFSVGGGNALNDYYDREVDLINHPDRPIPSGEIDSRKGLYFGLLLFLLASILSALINFYAFLITLIAIASMFLYESRLKKEGLAGNVTISFLVALIFIFGGAIYGEFCKVLIFALMAGSANLGREIVKDIEDMQGDLDRRTLPKRIGERKAALVAAMAFLFSIIISPVPYFYLSFGLYYLIAVVVSDAIFIYTAAIQFKDAHRAQRSAKLGMLMGLIAYLIGGLT